MTTTDKQLAVERAREKYSKDRYSAEELHTDDEDAFDISTCPSAETVLLPDNPINSRTQDQINQRSYSEALEALTAKFPRTPRNTPPVSRYVTMPPAARMSSNIGTRVMRPSMQSTQTHLNYSGPPTPTNDDMPYLRYAIDQITREGEMRSSTLRGTSGESCSSYPRFPERSLKQDRVRPRYDDELDYDNGPGPDLGSNEDIKAAPAQPKAKYNPKDSLASLALPTTGSELYLAAEPPVHTARYPALTFVPKTLRPWSLTVLVLLCISTIVGLGLCIEFADDLWPHTGSFDAKYFTFRFLPQIIAASLFLWFEGVMAAVGRIVPFVQMTSEDHQARQKSLFLPFQPTTLLWPRFSYFSSGQIHLSVCSVLIWPAVLTIPLASCLFTVTNINGLWKYSTVTSIAGVLITIYILIVLGLVGIILNFVRRETGLLWDPRSLADIIALLSRSNCMDDYEGTEDASDLVELREKLQHRADRLGYWRTTNPTQDIFYCIGEEGAPLRRHGINRSSTEPLIREKTRYSGDTEAQMLTTRLSHIPWYLGRSVLLLWPIAFGVLLIALFVVSFLPSIALSSGFRPQLSANPNKAHFIPSSFFYSFVPSTIGLALYGALRPMTYSIARLTPWSELARTYGTRALPSLLADYSASSSVPFAALSLAIENKHWLVALLAVVHPLMILLPILGGGMFAAYTTFPSETLLVLTDMAAFYVILALLIGYFIALVAVALALVPWEAQEKMKLPSSMSSLAEVVSVIGQSGLRGDAAFRAVRGRTDLRTRLVGARERGRGEVKYFCGEWREGGRVGWGVERMGRSERS
ncbi:hypothetical protein V493_07361 [Pseudogymnoascus sp. VKM F-4281 (FW-2241)]|nr:hypothetical protein V493_07361 [Pseudogymnoascus sp. VKM F-4281 (FW-2241)]